jgi:predicted RNase H-like HicB family nuclease
MAHQSIRTDVSFFAALPFVMKFDDETQAYVASCPVLDVVSMGMTKEEAKHNLLEAASLFLTTCFEMGTLEQVLCQCGFVRGIAETKSGKRR